MLKRFVSNALIAMCTTCCVHTSVNASLISGVTAHVWPDERTGGQIPSESVDGDLNTYTWSTRPNTNRPNHLGFDFGKIEYVNRIRLWKTNYGDWGEIVPKNLTIQYTSDLGPMSSRQWHNVPNLTNGFHGTEILQANAVNADGTVEYDNHDSGQHGWASLMFCPVEATGIRITFSNAKSYPFVHYRVYEFEVYYEESWPPKEVLDFEDTLGDWTVKQTGSPSHGLSRDYAHSGVYSYKTGPSNCGVNCFNANMVTLTRSLNGTRITNVTFYLYEQGCWGGKCRLKINGIEVGNWNPRPNNCPPQPGWIECSWNGDTICDTIEVQAWDLTSSDPLYIDDISVSAGCNESVSIYVDDNAPHDPGPRDEFISDPAEDGTEEHPFDMIQEGINTAHDGDSVFVSDGTYWETIDFKGKNIKVTGLGVRDTRGEIRSYPVIDGSNEGPVVSFTQGENPNAELSGFTITRGLYDVGSAILCLDSHPTITHCLVVGNRTTDLDFGNTIYCINSNSTFENCTVVGNFCGINGAGMVFADCNAVISNSIVWNNVPEQISVESGNDPIVVYSNIQGTWPGIGNVDKDSLFYHAGDWVDLRNTDIAVETNHPNATWIDGDYHLMSRAGRWDPVENAWVIDESTSPCIDAGDPSSFWEVEPSPNGERINLGAYGGSPQASKSPDDCCLTVSSGEGGRVIVAPGILEDGIVEPGETRVFCFDCGEQVTFIVEPDPNRYFGGWSDPNNDLGPFDPNGGTYTLTVTPDAKLTPVFPAVDLEPIPGPGGSIDFVGGEPRTYDRETPVQIIAKTDPCYHFTHWSGTAVDFEKVADPLSHDTTVIVDADYSLKANFALIEPSDLTISSGTGGSVTNPGEGTFPYDCNSVVAVVATAEPCYVFTQWSGTAVDTGQVKDPNDPSTTVSVNSDQTLIANFQLNESHLTVSSNEGGSVIPPGEGDFTFNCSTVVSIAAIPDSCYRFVGWTGSAVNAGKVENPDSPLTTVLVDADHTLIANFEVLKYALTLSSTVGGSVPTPGEGSHVFDCNASVRICAKPDPCYRFSHWSGTAVEAGKVADPHAICITVSVNSDDTLIANFELVTYTLTLSSTDGGSVTTPGEGAFPYNCNTSVPVAATPEQYYRFTHWSGTAVDKGKVANPELASTTVLVDGEDTLRAHFTFVPHLPDPSTYRAKQITSTSAVFRGCVVDDGGSACQYRFRYWEEGGPEQTTAWQGKALEWDILTLRIQGLSPNTTYYYALELRNDIGEDGDYHKRKFTTSP